MLHERIEGVPAPRTFTRDYRDRKLAEWKAARNEREANRIDMHEALFPKR